MLNSSVRLSLLLIFSLNDQYEVVEMEKRGGWRGRVRNK